MAAKREGSYCIDFAVPRPPYVRTHITWVQLCLLGFVQGFVLTEQRDPWNDLQTYLQNNGQGDLKQMDRAAVDRLFALPLRMQGWLT